MPREFDSELVNDVALVFRDAGVEYLFFGSIGALILGFPATMQDVQIFAAPSSENRRRIVSALARLKFRISEDLETDILAGRNVTISDGPFDLELFFAMDGVESFATASGRRIFNDGFPVANLRDIIASKRASGRPKDLTEIPMMEKFLEEYERLHPRPLKNASDTDRY